MEYIDICDSDGNLLGKIESKEEVHKNGYWHKAAHVWILNSKKELLIQKRSPLKDNHPNEWDISAAGHVSAGEDLITTAVRETEEEIGLKFKKDDFIQIGIVKQTSEREGYINKEINPIYIIKKDLNLNDIKKQPEEVSEVKFIPYKELEYFIEKEDPSFVKHPKEYKILFDYLNKN
ncbi:MAG: NUDIX domain-containing protein [Burkholderiales bacterium]|nr:NUDIX domain-containing protein [Burkholderiales bacterium]